MKSDKSFVAGIEVFSGNKTALLNEYWAKKKIKENDNAVGPDLIFSANGESVALYHSSKLFKSYMEEASIIHADGMSVVFASRIFSKVKILDRIATTDFFHDMIELPGQSHFFLGATKETNLLAVNNIARTYPKAIIAGTHHGYFKGDRELDSIVDIVKKAEPDIVWIALGRPLQEKVAIELRNRVASPTWIKTCGGLLDFLAKNKKRSPKWLQLIGLEWAFRLAQEPRRLWKRYFITNCKSIYLFIRYRERFKSSKLKEL